jgi:hypothetical protein
MVADRIGCGWIAVCDFWHQRACDAEDEVARLTHELEAAERERDAALAWIGYYFRSASEYLSKSFRKPEAIAKGRRLVVGLDAEPDGEVKP